MKASLKNLAALVLLVLALGAGVAGGLHLLGVHEGALLPFVKDDVESQNVVAWVGVGLAGLVVLAGGVKGLKGMGGNKKRRSRR